MGRILTFCGRISDGRISDSDTANYTCLCSDPFNVQLLSLGIGCCPDSHCNKLLVGTLVGWIVEVLYFGAKDRFISSNYLDLKIVWTPGLIVHWTRIISCPDRSVCTLSISRNFLEGIIVHVCGTLTILETPDSG